MTIFLQHFHDHSDKQLPNIKFTVEEERQKTTFFLYKSLGANTGEDTVNSMYFIHTYIHTAFG